MLVVNNLAKSFGGRPLFEGVSFSLGSNEKAGLVGRNGHGKTTLFRILAGEEEPDSGQIQVSKDYRVGYLRQENADLQETVLLEAAKGLPVHERESDWKVKKILSGLGFSEADFLRAPQEFSGGYQMRIQLAGVLAGEPDLLLLDEPTNYLDIVSIRWLEETLKNFSGACILISHDRRFIDSITTEILGITRRNLKKKSGSTGDYYAWLENEDAVHEQKRKNIERRRNQTERFIQEFRAKARQAGLAQSRMKTLAKQENLVALEQARNLSFTFNEAPCEARVTLNVRGLEFSYDPVDTPLIHNLTFGLHRGEILGVAGPNGKGKTTFLKLLAGKLQPHSGSVRFNPQVEWGYFAKEQADQLDEDQTVTQTLLQALPVPELQRARDLCGLMMFSGDASQKKVRVLSGGEKSRVLLGCLLAKPVNLLLLDEPTHHLDLESVQALQEALLQFQGSIILVTHDETLLEALCDRMLIFKEYGAFLYEGRYKEFLQSQGWETDLGLEKTQGDLRSGKNRRKKRAEWIQEKSRALKPLRDQKRLLETSIHKLEQDLARLEKELIAASEAGSGDKIAGLTRKNHRLKAELEEALHLWEKAGMDLEHQESLWQE